MSIVYCSAAMIAMSLNVSKVTFTVPVYRCRLARARAPYTWVARELALREAVFCANLVRGWTSLTVASAHEAENERDKESPRRGRHFEGESTSRNRRRGRREFVLRQSRGVSRQSLAAAKVEANSGPGDGKNLTNAALIN